MTGNFDSTTEGEPPAIPPAPLFVFGSGGERLFRNTAGSKDDE